MRISNSIPKTSSLRPKKSPNLRSKKLQKLTVGSLVHLGAPATNAASRTEQVSRNNFTDVGPDWRVVGRALTSTLSVTEESQGSSGIHRSFTLLYANKPITIFRTFYFCGGVN
jgi:hypothetical protein